MNTLHQAHGRATGLATRIGAVAALIISAAAAQAGHVPENLGAGLREIAAKRMSAQNPGSALARERAQRAASSDEMLTIDDSAVVRDRAGRVLVNIVVHGQHRYEAVRA